MNGKRILVVDDSEIIRHLVECTIKEFGSGYQVALANNGVTALAELHKESFDLMMTDFNMPGMTGIELAQKVHQILPDLRIVLMTGRDIIETEAEARRLHLNFDGYLNKSFTLAQLSRIVVPKKA